MRSARSDGASVSARRPSSSSRSARKKSRDNTRASSLRSSISPAFWTRVAARRPPRRRDRVLDRLGLTPFLAVRALRRAAHHPFGFVRHLLVVRRAVLGVSAFHHTSRRVAVPVWANQLAAG